MTHNKAVDLVRREQRRRADQLDEVRAGPDPGPGSISLPGCRRARGQIREALAGFPPPIAR